MDIISSEEVEEVKRILRRFYPEYDVERWSITPETYLVLERMLIDSARCTRAMHLVPRPGVAVNPLRYLQAQARQKIRLYFLSGEGRHYLSCMKLVAAKYRTSLEEASMY